MGVWGCLDLTSDILDPIKAVILAYPVIRVITYRSCVVVKVFVVEGLFPFALLLIQWFESRVDGTGR